MYAAYKLNNIIQTKVLINYNVKSITAANLQHCTELAFTNKRNIQQDKRKKNDKLGC